MSSLAWRLRAAALLSGGVLAVHQLRYLLPYGRESHHAPRAHGHAYLVLLLAAVMIALTLCAASLVVALARADVGAGGGALPKWRRLWGVSSGLLLLSYIVQESLEGALGSRHTVGLASIAGHGGWIVLPLAILVGLVIALLLRGAATAISRVAGRIRRPARRRSSRARRHTYRAPASSLESFARFLVGRGPPVLCR